MTTIAKTARFQVKPGSIERCLDAIGTFVRAVGENEPGTLFYVALQDQTDPTAFVHAFAFADADAEQSHRGTPWVERFTDVLYPEAIDGVRFDDMRLVAACARGVGSTDMRKEP